MFTQGKQLFWGSLLVLGLALTGYFFDLEARQAQERQYHSTALVQIYKMVGRIHYDPTQLDLAEWNMENAFILPSGRGTVTGDGNLVTITLRWDAKGTGALGTRCGGNPKIDLTCRSLSITQEPRAQRESVQYWKKVWIPKKYMR